MTNLLLLVLFASARIPSLAHGWIGYPIATTKPVSLSCCLKASTVHVFAHFANGKIDRVRVKPPECALDPKGETLQWIDGVSDDESRTFLLRAVEDGERHATDGALLALSLQAGGTDALIDVARHSPDGHIRGQALFWLSQQAGEKAAAALRDAVDNDPEESVKVRAVFGIAQLPDDQSIPMLVDLIEHNRSPRVRKRAAFWLGQKNDPRALAAIEKILLK